MNLSTAAISAVGALFTILALDGLWLGLIARKFYADELGDLMRKDVQWWAAVVFYVLYAVGIVFFVVQPAVAAKSLRLAMFMGAALGFLAYATYDLTNLAVLRGFTLRIALVDLAWGTVLTAAAATVATYVALRA